MLVQQSEGKADSTPGARPACLKAEAKVPVERRKLRKVVRAAELEKEPWFKKSNERKESMSIETKEAGIAGIPSAPALYLLLNKCLKGGGEKLWLPISEDLSLLREVGGLGLMKCGH